MKIVYLHFFEHATADLRATSRSLPFLFYHLNALNRKENKKLTQSTLSNFSGRTIYYFNLTILTLKSENLNNFNAHNNFLRKFPNLN